MIQRAFRPVPRRLRQAARLAIAVIPLVIAGCGSVSSLFGSSSSASGGSSDAGLSPSACPSTVVLRPLANTAVFGPQPALRPENVAFYGVLSDATSRCRLENGALRMALEVVVIGERGPAAAGGAVDLTYFVAVTGPDQTIISKKPFSVHLAFEGSAKRAGVTDHIEEAVPLNGQPIANIAVDVGFQQSPNAIEFYKRFRGR